MVRVPCLSPRRSLLRGADGYPSLPVVRGGIRSRPRTAGTRGRSRTPNRLIWNQVLYRLSYSRIEGVLISFPQDPTLPLGLRERPFTRLVINQSFDLLLLWTGEEDLNLRLSSEHRI